jgi:hypothetical protein
MTLHLDDYAELLESLGERPADVLRASWQEAARVFSPSGLQEYLQSALALKGLGRGSDLVVSFVQEAPEVAREIGEQAVADLACSCLAMASKTSATVITLVCATAPVAARRLGDAELFRGYLRLLENLLAQAPRGLRPMLDHLEQLLSQLTLGGLRRWAQWGAQAHRTDFDAQARYFALASADSLAVLQDERRGTLFVDVQRRIGAYLRALWGRDFLLRPTSGDYEAREGYRPYIEDFVIHLPDAYDDADGITGLALYRAASTHAAAHLAYTREPLSPEALTPLQMALIGVIEDARVEALALAAFPGLKTLWLPHHAAKPGDDRSVRAWLERLARALIDEAHEDGHPWIAAARRGFADARARLGSNRLSWELGVALANGMPTAAAFNPRSDRPAIAYRDDNRYVWEFAGVTFEQASAAAWRERQVRRRVSLMEFVNEVDVETAGDDAQEVWVLGSELFPYEDRGVSFNQMEGKAPVADPRHYPEWDYALQLERPSWCTLLEHRPAAGDPSAVEGILARHRLLLSRLRRLVEAMQPQSVQRLRKQEDGDDIDLNAAVQAFTDLRAGSHPDTRVGVRHVRKVRDLAVLLLLDLSASANDPLRGSEATVLSLTREAAVLLAEAINGVGDLFAIHGFSSDGRHDVRYVRFKDFGAPYDAAAKARLAGMTAELSTRMGAAMRHAGSLLRRQPQARKLLIVVSDGEPADIDERDPQYLRHDAKRAVDELARAGVATFCLSLDPDADPYVARIFGARNYRVLDRVERLPEQLPLLYLGMTR